ncbi:DUF2975 domain-containing protein [Mariniflexile sp. AS56]|uniref:DUF2975 domain-containing protein n=1 Tax=Mariniflexile sp. AS56 TaxID=3063957 RepID=UPI0026EA28C8|nr:DUF2975 domain-containing protein [Mariniflexile sp. AS56]MDO7171081.1 DUF2975 domain-containing protein [Mariniflexile sp. AS56]
MTKSTLLNVAITLSRVCKTIFILLIIGFTAIFIHLQLDRSFYNPKKFNLKTGDGYSYSMKWKSDKNAEFNEVFTLDKLKTVSLYVTYLKFLGVLILIYLCIWEFQKIMQSVKVTKTFGENNVQSFRRIGQFLMGYAILTSYTSFRFENAGFKGISIPFTAIFLVLCAFIMAEIFKEGILLKEEYDLTV